MQFQDLKIIPPIQKALVTQGYETPTPIQEQAIPALLSGSDLLGCAQTGTGKTAAFAIPILQHLALSKKAGDKIKIRALIVPPTRELALQIGDSFLAYGKHLDLNTLVIFGGVPQNPQVRGLQKGVDILVATPGRLLDLMNQGFISLDAVEKFVLDEADMMLDMGMLQEVKRIVARLPKKRQTMFFSATMPEEIALLANTILSDPLTIKINPGTPTVEKIEQRVYFTDKNAKIDLLVHLLQTEKIDSVIVFSRTKHGADKIVHALEKHGINSKAIHGNKSQNNRQQALGDFKEHRVKILVATDIAARGIDVEELSHVINFDLPEVPETYIHRIGRTGRAGLGGKAISFCDYDEKPMLAGIEKLIKRTIPPVLTHPYPMSVFVASPKKVPMPRGERRQNGGGQPRGNGQRSNQPTSASVQNTSAFSGEYKPGWAVSKKAQNGQGGANNNANGKNRNQQFGGKKRSGAGDRFEK